MATRKTYSDEQKSELINKYKSDYVNSSRSSIKGKKVTKEVFDSLHKDMQWHKIYMNYVRKLDSKDQELAFPETTRISFSKIRKALNTVKDSMDDMSDSQIKKTFDAFDEIKSYYSSKKMREQNQKVKVLEEKEALLKDQLEKILAAKAKLRDI